MVALFGYDFLLTAAGRPVLIEVNANPMLSPNNGWRAALPVPTLRLAPTPTLSLALALAITVALARHALLLARLAHDYLRLALDARWPPA